MDITQRIRAVEKKVETAKRNGCLSPYVNAAKQAQVRFFEDAARKHIRLEAWGKRLAALQASITFLEQNSSKP